MAIRTPGVNDLSLRQLQYVVAVADTLGFHRAAESLGVSQPTLSAQIQQLESVLGVALFERDRRRVLVTKAGEEVVLRAKRVLVDVDDLLAAASAARDPFAGTFRIGVIPTVAPYVLPEVTPVLAETFPRLRLVFREEKTADVVRGLLAGELDAGLVARVPELGDLAFEDLLEEKFVAALPKGHALASKKKLAMKDLEDQEVLLLDEGHCLRAQALELCSRAGAHEGGLRATSLATLSQMVSAGQGLTLLPELAVPVENRRGQLAVRPFVQPVPSRTLSLVWRPASPFAAAFGQVAAVLRRALRSAARAA
jgi:LysR family transcriptional regulator, hydrogen peroxide-inducible genes activator